MSRTHVRTRPVTLYRVPFVSVQTMIEAIDVELADEIGGELQFPDVAGLPAIWVDGCLAPDDPSEWCADAALTTGLPIDHRDRRSGGLLLLAVDNVVYAIGYGQHGHRLLLDEHKDHRFGLRFAIRALDPHQVQDLQRRFPAARGRSDITCVPGGLPIYSFGIEPAEIVRGLGGVLHHTDLTFGRGTQRKVRVEGAAGLRLRLGVAAADLVADIRAVADVCAKAVPDPLLKFIDYVQPVQDQATLDQLHHVLEELLARGLDDADAHLAPVVPTSCLRQMADARSFRIKIGKSRATVSDHLDLDIFLERLSWQDPGQRVQALREGRVHLCAAGNGKDLLTGTMAVKWLEATCSLGSRRFHLLDGQWYEIGAGYLEAVRGEIERILGAPPSLDLPPWRPDWTEGDYNQSVPQLREGYVCLDRTGVRNPFDASNRVEVCDLLGPDDELIHVKQAKGSAPLSHLFNQALVSTQTLAYSPHAGEQFAALVKETGRGRSVPPDFQPKKVVLAVLLKNKAQLTPGALFPFSQVTLAHTATTLRNQHQISVEVMGIPRAA
ncbi:DUF6119 family protein [Actinomadura scrupuli]|uniref:DUF6119 family protein n=1 Tax=Actinomadura scrupuli TaxID=559629 RepID=UPI003D95C3EF